MIQETLMINPNYWDTHCEGCGGPKTAEQDCCTNCAQLTQYQTGGGTMGLD